MRKGRIFTEYWIQCGVCEYMEALAARTRQAAEEARIERGWVRRYTAGYICPDCVKKAYPDRQVAV